MSEKHIAKQETGLIEDYISAGDGTDSLKGAFCTVATGSCGTERRWRDVLFPKYEQLGAAAPADAADEMARTHGLDVPKLRKVEL